MQQNYGVLRVIRVRLPATATANLQDRYPSGWLPEERLVHLLTQTSTSIGRALNNDIVLIDPTVSREHARLGLDASGWRITNLTEQNIVRVNGRPVPSGGSLPMQPQDILILGSTMLQLIAPNTLPSAPSRPASVNGAGGASLPRQPAPELVAQPWDEDEEESLLGAGVTMQFALPQRMG